MASYHFRTSLSTLTFTKQAIHRLAGLSVTAVRNANLMASSCRICFQVRLTEMGQHVYSMQQ